MVFFLSHKTRLVIDATRNILIALFVITLCLFIPTDKSYAQGTSNSTITITNPNNNLPGIGVSVPAGGTTVGTNTGYTLNPNTDVRYPVQTVTDSKTGKTFIVPSAENYTNAALDWAMNQARTSNPVPVDAYINALKMADPMSPVGIIMLGKDLVQSTQAFAANAAGEIQSLNSYYQTMGSQNSSSALIDGMYGPPVDGVYYDSYGNPVATGAGSNDAILTTGVVGVDILTGGLFRNAYNEWQNAGTTYEASQRLGLPAYTPENIQGWAGAGGAVFNLANDITMKGMIASAGINSVAGSNDTITLFHGTPNQENFISITQSGLWGIKGRPILTSNVNDAAAWAGKQGYVIELQVPTSYVMNKPLDSPMYALTSETPLPVTIPESFKYLITLTNTYGWRMIPPEYITNSFSKALGVIPAPESPGMNLSLTVPAGLVLSGGQFLPSVGGLFSGGSRGTPVPYTGDPALDDFYAGAYQEVTIAQAEAAAAQLAAEAKADMTQDEITLRNEQEAAQKAAAQDAAAAEEYRSGAVIDAQGAAAAKAEAALQTGSASQTSGSGGGVRSSPVSAVTTSDDKYKEIERRAGEKYAGDPCSFCRVDSNGDLFVTDMKTGKETKITGAYNEHINEDPSSPTFGDLEHQQTKDPTAPDPGGGGGAGRENIQAE